MNTIIQILKTNKQKITYLILSGMLMVSFVTLVSTVPVVDAVAPSIAITFSDADADNDDTDDATTKTREKTVTASDSANNAGTTWKHKILADAETCDAAEMADGTRTGNTIRMSSESTYNNRKICFEATNGSDVEYQDTALITGIDRQRPNQPTGITLAASDDTGSSTTDGLTQSTEDLTITGCAETDSTVTLLVDNQPFNPAETGTANGSACTASGTSEFSIDIDLAERARAYKISATATDAAGNVSSRSSSSENATIIVDTTAPTVALTHKLTGGVVGEGGDYNHLTYLNAGDTIAVTMTFTEANGMSEEISARPTVTFYGSSGVLGGITSLGTDTPTATGNTKVATYTVSGTETVAAGNLKYDITNEASIVDKAGNVLATQEEKVIANTIIDTTAPTVGNIAFTTTNSNNGQAAESDEITATMTFSEKVSEKVSNTGIFYRLGTSGAGKRFSFASGRNFISGQCQETSTANQYVCKYTVEQGDAGVFQVSVDKFADYAGNAGTKAGFVGEIMTDTGATAPTAITLKRGIKNRDKNIAPTFVVTVGENGGTVTLYEDSDCSTEVSGAEPVDDTRSPYTVEIVTNDYEDDGSDDGLKTIYAEHTDDASNTSGCSTAYGSYTLDTSSPLVDESETGYYSDASVTQLISLTDGKGRVAAGNNIYTKVVFDEEVRYRPGSSASALPEIKYTIGDNEHRYRIVSYNSTLSGGRCKPTSSNNISDTYICQYRVRSNDVGTFAVVVDTATEDLLEHTLEETYTHADSIMLDNTAPAKPSALDLSADDDSGNITDDNVTNKVNNLTIEGCAETDSSVQLYANGVSITGATDTANDAGHTCDTDDNGFSIDISLTEGTQRITAKATDDSGNTSAASDALVIIVDTTAPTAALTGMPTGTNNVDVLDVTVAGTDVTHYQHEVLNGTSCANANYSGGDTDGTAIADKITDSIPTRDGSIILCVVGRDKAGNWQTKANATTATWTRDRTGPAKPTGLTLDAADDTGLLATDGITRNTNGLTITGCAETDSTVEILKDGTSFSTAVTDVADTTNVACNGGMKQFSADISLADGDREYLITAKATDQSGNVSDASDALTITIKTVAPTITAANLDLATDDDSGTNTSDDITNKKTDLTISGTLSGAPATGDYVQLYDGSTLLDGATDSSFTGADNSWTVDIALSTEGRHTVNAQVLDVAGNEGAAVNMTVTIDTTGPTVSVTEHIATPTSDATPDITIRTSAAGEVSFGGKCADTSANPTLQTITAGTHTVTLPELENKTYDDCTVMVKDETGNLSDGATIREFVVDNTPPTIVSAAVNNAARTETKVTFNERVYAPTAPSAGDFRLEIGGITYADLVTGISGIASTKVSASQSLILTHSELPTGDVAVKYVKGTNHIFDQIGNTLETTESTPISATQFALVALHADDDTGPDTTDGVTRFDGDEVTLTISLNTGTYTNGDRVRVFMGSSTTAVVSYTISDSIRGAQYIDAADDASFDITLPKSRFRVGANTMSATYAKVGSIEGGRGAVTTITYDTTAPTVRVRSPNTSVATQKEVSATDNESGTTVWKYKALTNAVELCNEAAMATETTAYTEGEALTFTDTTDNGNRICFASEDGAGNIGYSVSNALSGIDGGAPTVTSVVATSTDGRVMRVTLNERVYASTAPALSDFKVVVGSDEYSIVGITDLATSVGSAKDTFTITLPSFASDVQMTLKYTAGTNTIKDVVGNPLASFTGQAINNVKLISLALDADDDTGPDTTDGITRFDGEEVTLVVSLNEGTFSNGDMVRLFVGNNSTPIRSYTISNLLTASIYKNATGKTSFTIDLPKRMFFRGVTNLSASYTPSGSTEGARGGILAITYDTVGPRITVRNPDGLSAQRKTVSAIDSDSTATVWQYKKISGTTVCEEGSMTDATSYTEDARTLVFSSEDDNGMKICFSSTDVAGNTSYQSSYALSGIDTTVPTVSGVSITTTSRTTTEITFSEPVYAATAISPTDFSITSGQGGQHVITGVTRLGTTAATASSSITLSHTPIAETATISLNYVKGSAAILDAVGNTLASFTESVANTPFAALALDAGDDTGTRDDDDITMFDGDEVSFTVSLTSGTFSVGDQVKIYEEGEPSPLKSVIIASAGANTVNASGKTSFSITLAKRLFTEGSVTLYANYAPVSRIVPTKNGIDFSFVYDKTAPIVTVTNPTDVSVAKSKRVSAADNDSSETAWQYKVIDEDVACDASAIATDATDYTEGSALDLTDNDLNGKKVCFSSTDVAGNVTYAVSDVLQGVDSVAPTVDSAAIENYERTNTVITFSERVYASSNLSPSAFSIEIGDTGHHYRVSTIQNLPTTARAASKTFTLVHPAVSGDISLRIVYTPGTGTIQDIAGNTLAGFTQNIATASFITLDLADEDDTGRDTTDNHTQLDDSTVSLTVSLTNAATFSNSDVVTLYRGESHSVVKRLTVSTFPSQDSVNANGASSFKVEIPKSVFDQNGATLLSAGYAPFGNTALNKIGGFLQVTVDTIAPRISVTDPQEGSALRKTVRATGVDTTDLEWKHAIIQSGVVCDADALRSGEEYTEGNDVVFDTEDSNGMKACFSATDLAGNTTYGSSLTITGIDAAVPTVSSVAVTGESVLTVTMSEPVYSAEGPDANDFVVFVNNSPALTDTVSGIPLTAAQAARQFTITVVDSFKANDVIALSYVGSSRSSDNELIKDTIGNALASFDKISVTLPATAVLTLDPRYDTGSDNSDGLTNFGDGTDAKFVITLSSGVFRAGDWVRIYLNSENSPLVNTRIGIREGEIDARGQTSLTVTIPKQRFTREETLTLRATHTAQLQREGLPSAPLTITYDTTAPDITVVSPNTEVAKSKVVRARDGDTVETVWLYKQISSGAKCNADQMASDTQAYTEGDEISFTSEDDNNTKVCFSATDVAGNVGYERSSVLRNIDTTAAVITVVDPTANPAQTKVVSATDGDTEATTWTYKQIAGDVSCDKATMASGTKAYTEGDAIEFTEESDNGTKICFSSTDGIGLVSYQASAVLAGIDRTAVEDVVIDILGTTSDLLPPDADPVRYARAKVVRASDNEATKTTWAYKQIMKSDACNEAQMQQDTKEYVEGANIVFDSESDNDTKVCFAITDNVGNTVYRESALITGIDTTVSAIIITKTADAVQARDADTADAEWKYKKIGGDLACDAGEMANGAQPYTEGTAVAITDSEDNGKKVCFSVTDTAGNTAYRASETISSIATTTSAWIDPALGGGEDVAWAKAKAVVGTDGNNTKTVWYYRQIAGDAACDASMGIETATSYVEGMPIVLRKESDNGTKICFLSVDQEGKVTAASSEIVTGIDTTAPTISITDAESGAAQEKVLRAADHDTAETAWTYKQIAGGATCDANQMSAGAQPYTENTDLTFTKESDNGTKVCFSAMDIAGNTVYRVSDVLDGIDATIPTVSSATLVDVRRTQTKVVVADLVSSFGDFSAENFIVEIDSAEYPVTKVSRFEQSETARQTSFTLTHAAIVQGASATLSYTAGNDGGIADSVGNRLESFSKVIFDKSFVALSLDPKDDTGVSTTDGITRFDDDDEVSLIATISEGTFSNGDKVSLYVKGRASFLKRVLISGAIVGATDAHGETSITLTVPKSIFVAGTETTLYTVFTPADGSNATGQRGSDFVIAYHKTVPHVTVTTDSVSAAMVTVEASDTHDADETIWQYAQIAADAECDASALTNASVYTEGDVISFTDEESNGTKVCFAAADAAGNTAYAVSEVIAIDLTAPAITIQPITSEREASKTIRATDNDDEKTVWKYRVITADTTCDEDAMRVKTGSYTEGTGLRFTKERANGHKVCFSSTDEAGNVLYAASMVMRGIDVSAPSITITMTGTKEKVVRARDTETSGSTVWQYRVIKGNAACAREMMEGKSRAYREGSGLVFRKAQANGHKVCFSAKDSVGNVSYEDSPVMLGIGAVNTRTPSTVRPLPLDLKSPLTPAPNSPLTPIQ